MIWKSKNIDIFDIIRIAARSVVVAIVDIYEILEKKRGQRDKNKNHQS